MEMFVEDIGRHFSVSKFLVFLFRAGLRLLRVLEELFAFIVATRGCWDGCFYLVVR